VNFSNNQQFDVSSTVDSQNAQQTSTVDSETKTTDRGLVTTSEEHFTYPLTVDFSFVANPDGSESQTTSVDQQFLLDKTDHVNSFPLFTSSETNHVHSQDTEALSATGALTTSPSSSQSFIFQDSKGDCFSRTLTSSNNVLTGVTNGQGCSTKK
jgi:hypothetical protein